jgi:hypothetical protein
MRNFKLTGAVGSADFSVERAICPLVRSSKVTLIVDTAVVVRKFRRLQPEVLFAEDVIVSDL